MRPCLFHPSGFRIEGEKILWTTLGDLAGMRARVLAVDFDDLLARADHQRNTVEPFRRQIGIEITTPHQPGELIAATPLASAPSKTRPASRRILALKLSALMSGGAGRLGGTS